MIRLVAKLYAFIRRDFLSMISYRLAFLLQVLGMFFSIAAFYFMTKMMNPQSEGLNGIPPFEYLLVGIAFLNYFATALYAFAAKIRQEQMMGTLEAMLVSPTQNSDTLFDWCPDPEIQACSARPPPWMSPALSTTRNSARSRPLSRRPRQKRSTLISSALAAFS